MAEYTDEQLQAAFPNQDLEHTRAMIDKMNGKGVETHPNADGDSNENNGAAAADTDTVEYPDFIPEKFRQGSVEDAMRKMAESYAHLERGRGAADAGAGSDGGDTGDAGGGEGDSDGDSADGEGDVAPLNLEAVEAEYMANNGTITEATYAAAEKAGMPRHVLDSYIAGQKAIADQLVSNVHNMAGGTEAYTTMLTWAETNWSEAEVAQFDKVIGTGDLGAISLAVKGLKADYVAANGKAPKLVNGDSDAGSEAEGFKSKAEMTAAIRDPRYKKDPAYRAEVARKIHAGNVWGNR